MTDKPMFLERAQSTIDCPNCVPVRQLVVRTNGETGRQFLGCPNFPDCTYTRPIPASWYARAAGQPTLPGME